MRHLLAIAALVAIPAFAQPQPQPQPQPSPGPAMKSGPDGPPHVMIQRMMTAPTLLSLAVNADVTRPPDTLHLSAGVVTTAPAAADAMAANAARMNLVIAELKAAGVAQRDIQTSSLTLAPQYRYQPEQTPVLTGYQARNSVTVKSGKLGDAGRLVDALVKAGANEVNGPMFSLADPEAALNQARTAAVAKARARAELYAAAAGMTVKRIVSISEAGAAGVDPMPRPMMRMAADVAESTPVQPGELALSAQLTIVFELDDRKR
jgi:uncharacterized protein